MPLEEAPPTWRVNEVNVVAEPGGVGGSRLYGDAALPLQVHEVHSGTYTVPPTHLVH